MRTYEWSSFYREAIHESDPAIRMARINIAVKKCLRSLLDIRADAGTFAEQREILCALHDLRVLIHVHRKYA